MKYEIKITVEVDDFYSALPVEDKVKHVLTDALFQFMRARKYWGTGCVDVCAHSYVKERYPEYKREEYARKVIEVQQRLLVAKYIRDGAFNVEVTKL